jgi:LPS-assembly protein
MTLSTLKRSSKYFLVLGLNIRPMQHFPARVAALLILLSGASFAWPQGLVLPVKPAPAAAQPQPPRPKGPSTIDAESIEGVSELEVSARGRVEFKREDLTVYSEFLRFNQEFGRIEADGGVRLQRGVDRFFGPRLRYNTQNDTGVFEEPTYLMGRGQTARGGAERLEFLGKDRLLLNRASFTTCEPGNDAWRIEADELELDYEKEEGRTRGMRLRMFDTTILALPFASFPLENRRKSGFLAPYYSHNTRRGIEGGLPYYWNIAPEQDLQITPIFMSKRGEQLKSNYRYMGEDYRGQLRVEYMPQDDVIKRPRSGFSYQHEQQFLPNLTARIDFNKVSDDRYFVDFATQVRAVSVGNLQREGLLNYSTDFFGMPAYLQGHVQRFQTLQDPLAPVVSPYHRVPQITFGVSKVDFAERFDFTLPGEYARFAHPSLVEGTRTSFNPTLTMPLVAPGYFVTPKIGMRSASYDLSRTAPGQPERQSLNVPYGSVDGGLIFERGMKLLGENLTQTLEPRFFYVYAPFRAQNQIPLFDTALADFNYAQLFSENRFAGGDRFGDANQLTTAVTSRILGAGGQELFRATLGQRYYFRDERVGLLPTSALRSRDQSDLLASVGARIAQSWTFDNTVQYNPQNARIERAGASIRYAPEIAKVINASYRYNRDPVQPIRQVDLSGQWPVQPGWYAIGRYNYSFRDKRILEGLAGLEYNGGCWVFRGVFQRIQAATQTTSTGMYFQIEFNGLGQIGSDDTVDFLKRTVPGYARTNPSDPQLVPQSLRPRLPFEQVF